MHRRLFLQGSMAASTASVASFNGLFSIPALAEQVQQKQKKVILLWLCGAPSQFETWDPKPRTSTGGPFGAIQTKLPGVMLGEMMPKTASLLDKTAIIRSMSTGPEAHFQGIDCLTRGDTSPSIHPTYPGSVIAEQLGQLDSPVPQFVLLDPCPEGNEFKSFKAGNWAGWLASNMLQYAVVRAIAFRTLPLPDSLNELLIMTASNYAVFSVGNSSTKLEVNRPKVITLFSIV